MILALLVEGSVFVTSVNTSVLVVLNGVHSVTPVRPGFTAALVRLWSLISSSVHFGLQVVTMRKSPPQPSESAPSPSLVHPTL